MSTRAPQRPTPLRPTAADDRLLPAWFAASLLLVLGMLAGMALSTQWLAPTAAWISPQAKPHWLPAEEVRATSGDGHVVKARVSLDAPDGRTRAWIRSRPDQFAMLLQVGVSQFHDGGTGGAGRVQQLGAVIRDRVNAHLAANDVAPIRDVMIEDMVIRAP